MSRRKAASGSKKRNCKGPGSRGVGERKTRSLVGLTIIELGGFCAKLSTFVRTESCRQAETRRCQGGGAGTPAEVCGPRTRLPSPLPGGGPHFPAPSLTLATGEQSFPSAISKEALRPTGRHHGLTISRPPCGLVSVSLVRQQES